MNYYEKNKKLLKEFRSDLYKQFVVFECNQNVKNSCDIDFITARDETPVPIIFSGEREFRLNSSYRPVSEADRWARQFLDKGELAVFVMFGLGSGIFVSPLLDHFDKNNRLIIYEPSAALFLSCMEKYDWTFLLEDSRVLIAVEGINERSFMDYMQTFIFWNNMDQVKIVIHPLFDQIFPSSCSRFCKIYEDARDTLIRNRNTDQRFATVKIQNMLQNWRYIKECSGVMQLAQVIPDDIPFILVSAGPSLWKNIRELKRAKGYSVIVGVDTVMPTLHVCGIEPDLFISIDPVKPMDSFRFEQCNEIPFLCTTCTNPVIMSRHKNKKIILKEDRFFQEIFKRLQIPAFQYNLGGCVATAAFAVCAEMKRKTVILVGQDLAYSDENKSHAGHNEGYKQDPQFYVDGVNGETVQSRSDWYTYLQWFKGAIGYCEDMRVIDATEGGARIEGAEIMTLNDAMDTFCQKEVSVAELIDGLEPLLSYDQCTALDNIMRDCQREIATVRDMAKEGMAICNKWNYEVKSSGMLTDKANEYNRCLYQINEKLMELLIFPLMDIYMVLCDWKEENELFFADQIIMEQAKIINDTKGLYDSMLRAVDYIESVMDAHID